MDWTLVGEEMGEPPRVKSMTLEGGRRTEPAEAVALLAAAALSMSRIRERSAFVFLFLGLKGLGAALDDGSWVGGVTECA